MREKDRGQAQEERIAGIRFVLPKNKRPSIEPGRRVLLARCPTARNAKYTYGVLATIRTPIALSFARAWVASGVCG